MANHGALAVDGGPDDIGARFQKLNLPARPLIMEKTNRACPHHQHTSCFCFEYTTLLDRPDYAGKYLRESPEPEVRTPKPTTNGSTTSTAKKKFKLDQYLAGKTSTTPKSDQRSSETSPNNNATNHAPTRGPPTSTSANSHPKTSTSHASTPTPISARPNSSSTALNSSRVPKASIPAKRHADISAGAPPPPPKTAPKVSTPDVSRPVKRQRLSPPPPIRHPLPPPPPPPARRSPPPHRHTPQPPRRNATPIPELPTLLSPTLPKAIEDALAAEDKFDDEIIAKPGRDRKTPNGIERAPPKSSQPNKKPPVSSSATPSGRSPRPIASPGKTLPKKPGPGATASKTTVKRALSPNPASPRPTKPPATSSKHPPVSAVPQRSRVVKLRFKRRLKDFQTLIKLLAPPNKRSRQTQEENGTSSSAAGRKAATGSLNVSKAASATARSPAFKSPAVKAPPARDREVVTPPKKATTGPAGKKSELGGGLVITPASNRDDNRNGFSNGTQSFMGDYERLSALGKSTKHEADAVFRSEKPNVKDFRRALVVGADSTLCFVLAFVLSDRARALENKPPVTDMWRTFIPLSQFVSGKAREAGAHTMLGFCKQMEFIVRQHLFDAEIAALSRVQYPDPNISKAPTPDSANSASNNQRRFQEIQGRIMDGQRNLKESWGEGIKNLSYDEIQKAFPETYAARSTKYIPPQPDVPRAAGKYRHAYMLPVHRNTTPLEGINFGRKFLEEWASENGIKYKSRLSDWL